MVEAESERLERRANAGKRSRKGMVRGFSKERRCVPRTGSNDKEVKTARLLCRLIGDAQPPQAMNASKARRAQVVFVQVARVVKRTSDSPLVPYP